MTARILAFSGSTRNGSFNQRLLDVAVVAAREAGAEVTMVRLRDFSLPLFDQDLEAEGTPAKATELKQLFLHHDGLLIASPEYNSSVSGVLKNAIDWVSRSAPGEPMKAAFLNKTAALLAASPGALGGLRGLADLRSILQNVGVMVIPQQFALGHADTAFDSRGQLKDERSQKSVVGIASSLVQTIEKLRRE